MGSTPKTKTQKVPEEARKKYEDALAKSREAVNKHSIILGIDFDKQLSRYIQVHRSIRDVDVTKCDKYRDFVAALTRGLDELFDVLLKTGTIPPNKHLTLAAISFEERNRMGPQEYLDKQFNYWLANKDKEKSP